jgi:hypothetical protein
MVGFGLIGYVPNTLYIKQKTVGRYKFLMY